MKKQVKRQRKPISTKGFLTIGRKHFAEDFPNPKRLGCPPGNELKLQAEKPLMAKEQVLNHISFCSPCYRAFSRFLREQRAKPKQHTVWRPERPAWTTSAYTRGTPNSRRRASNMCSKLPIAFWLPSLQRIPRIPL